MKRNVSSGITTLELMISLVVMGLIALLLANALDFNRRSLDRAALTSENTESYLLRHAIRRWVEDIPLDYNGGTARDFFDGAPDQLRFRARVIGGENAAEINEFRIARFGDLLAVVRYAPDVDATRQTLMENVAQTRFQYFGLSSADSDPQWHDAWADDIYLPTLVKIEWTDTMGRPRPPLVMQPGKTQAQSVMSLSSLVPPG